MFPINSQPFYVLQTTVYCHFTIVTGACKMLWLWHTRSFRFSLHLYLFRPGQTEWTEQTPIHPVRFCACIQQEFIGRQLATKWSDIELNRKCGIASVCVCVWSVDAFDNIHLPLVFPSYRICEWLANSTSEITCCIIKQCFLYAKTFITNIKYDVTFE